MIVGIGCDIVKHSTLKTMGWLSDEKLLRRVFSEKEMEIYLKNKCVKFLAGRFAVKEAVFKCLGTGMLDGMSLTDIEVLNFDFGKPNIQLSKNVELLANKLSIKRWSVSISHTTDSSLSFVIAEK